MVPWLDPYWPVKRGRDFTEKGFFSEPDKENFLKEFRTTSTAENIPAKYFHQGAGPYAKREVVTF